MEELPACAHITKILNGIRACSKPSWERLNCNTSKGAFRRAFRNRNAYGPKRCLGEQRSGDLIQFEAGFPLHRWRLGSRGGAGARDQRYVLAIATVIRARRWRISSGTVTASQSDFSASPQTEKEPLSLSLSKRLGQLQGRLAVEQVRPCLSMTQRRSLMCLLSGG
jgi:hypothetical protein